MSVLFCITNNSMNFARYYFSNKTYITRLDDRLKKVVEIIFRISPKTILDVGCGSGFMVSQLQEKLGCEYYGVDVHNDPKKLDFNYKKADITKGLPYPNNKFVCVFMGEILEHVPDTDFLLSEAHRVLKRGGYLVISTPNLACWANRILLLFGVQPLFTETSVKKKLGRYFKFLGQGNKSQGHLKIFTSSSLEEILTMSRFRVKEKYGVRFGFPFPISLVDAIFVHFVSLASGLLYVAVK